MNRVLKAEWSLPGRQRGGLGEGARAWWAGGLVEGDVCNSGTWTDFCISVSIVTCVVVTETDSSWLGLSKGGEYVARAWDGSVKPWGTL